MTHARYNQFFCNGISAVARVLSDLKEFLEFLKTRSQQYSNAKTIALESLADDPPADSKLGKSWSHE